MSDLKLQLKDAQKQAMREKNKPRLTCIRTMMSEFKRIEVDERIELDQARGLAVLDKMLKQRRDSISQYEAADRQDLADIEHAEISVIQEFLPTPLKDDEISSLITQAIADSGASSMQDMGKVMAILKPQLQGRADIGKVSGKIKAHLA